LHNRKVTYKLHHLKVIFGFHNLVIIDTVRRLQLRKRRVYQWISWLRLMKWWDYGD